MGKTFAAYYRVSTDSQKASGLGLDAQQSMVEQYVKGVGGRIIASFEEAESGKGGNALALRPQLRAAVAVCKRKKATLVIAKLDRVSRNTHFITGLMESGIDFVIAAMPQANKVIIQMYAVMSEWERDQISERTRAALQAWKVRNPDKKLGNPIITPTINEPGTAEANEFANNLQLTLEGYLARGLTQKQMAKALAKAGVPTMNGGTWSQTQVSRALARLRR